MSIVPAETASTRSKNRCKTLEKDFKKVHGDKYTYNKFMYKQATVKSIITCPLHGDFLQNSNDHLNGYGCYYCGREIVERAKRKSIDTFIKEAKSKHGNFIDYSKVVYKNTSTEVILICPIHGEFKQQPNVHLVSKFPCPKCGKIDSGIRRRIGTEEFIKKANILHKNAYSYIKTNYTNIDEKVIITCPLHGDFQQTPNNHLHGNGCPACGQSGFKENKFATLYYVSVNNGEAYKIGITNRTIKERFRKDYGKIKVLGTVEYLSGKDAREKETEILRKYFKFKYTGPDLLHTGNSELFNIDILKLDKRKNNEVINC